MGAGLLTFASRSLNTVVEENRGQRAFELADAGVGIAKRQLTADCVGDADCTFGYDLLRDADGTIHEPVGSAPDIQWSWLEGGVTLSDLDGDDNVTTVDSVHVAIDYQAGIGRNRFKITSTGTYGESRRKIEATLRAQNGGLGGEGIGHPLYYTPSSITIEGSPDPRNAFLLNGISMFTKGDIVMKGLPEAMAGSGCGGGDPVNAPLRTDYEENNCGIFAVNNNDQGLGNWYSPGFEQRIRGNWNTVGRLGYNGSNFRGPGFAAEGRICAVEATDPIDGECRDSSGNPRPSIADGVYGYDSTTGTKGNNWAFAEKINCTTSVPEPTRNPNGTTCTEGHDIISYPFPLMEPRERRLALIAQEQEAEGGGGDYYKASPATGCEVPWADMLVDTNVNAVFFVDLGDCVNVDGTPMQIPTEWGNAMKTGIIVTWCGSLHQTSNSNYGGIIMNLNGDGLNADGSSFASNCEDDTDVDGDLDTDEGDPRFGVYRLDGGSDLQGWLYSEGGTSQRAGIELVANEGSNATQLRFNSGANPNFLDDILSTDTPPTGFITRSWRECYELEEDPIENARVC
jgi:hypothetical protein